MASRASVFAILLSIIISTLVSCGEEPQPLDPSASGLPTFERAGTIGEQGGLVQISDKASPLHGAFVEIPADSFEDNNNVIINEVTEGYSFEGDSTSIFVSLEPSGIQFKQPIRIGIPYSQSISPENLRVYFFSEDEYVWKPLPTISVDTTQRIVIAETNHFSVFTVHDSHVKFRVELYRTRDDKISAHVTLSTPLNKMPAEPATFLSIGAQNISELIEKNPYNIKAHYTVTLREKKDWWWWLGPSIESKIIIYGIPTVTLSDRYEVEAYELNADTLERNILLSSSKYLDLDDVEDHYSAEPLLFEFSDSDPDPGKEYYVEVKPTLSRC